MSYKLSKLIEPVLLGEGPHWDARQQALFFVSIPQKSIHKFVPATKTHTKTLLTGRPGFIVLVEGTTDQFVVGLELQFVVIQWDGSDGGEAKILRVLADCGRDEYDNKTRINDGKCDPKGRLFAGTMGDDEDRSIDIAPNKGSLYRLDSSQSKLSRLVQGVTVSNGLAWDLREKAFYYTDSAERNIRRYDYDVETGEISNQTYIFDFEANKVEGVPDGTTIDTDGNLWVAVWEGSCVLKIDPRTGTLLTKIPIPALQITSVTFGGPDHDVLFVTSGSINIDGPQLPPCGATFTITGLGVKGHPNVGVKL